MHCGKDESVHPHKVMEDWEVDNETSFPFVKCSSKAGQYR